MTGNDQVFGHRTGGLGLDLSGWRSRVLGAVVKILINLRIPYSMREYMLNS